MNNVPDGRPLTAANPIPVPDSYWVVPGRLLAGEYPGAKAEAEARRRLPRFLDAGVTFFLDLTEAGEPLSPYAPLLREEAAGRNVVAEHHRMPIPDYSNPSPAQVVCTLDAIDAAIAAGKCVYVHCWGGIGRTGTIIGCYLVRHGMTGPQALTEIAHLRQGTPDGLRTSPETTEQQNRVRDWPVGA